MRHSKTFLCNQLALIMDSSPAYFFDSYYLLLRFIQFCFLDLLEIFLDLKADREHSILNEVLCGCEEAQTICDC